MRALQVLLTFLLISAATVMVAQNDGEIIMTESSEPIDDIFVDDVVKKNLIVDNRVLPYEHVREADVVWQKKIWRVLDTREKMNLGFMNPLRPFLTIITDAATSGEITLFRTDDFDSPMTQEEFNKIVVRIDTSVIFDPDTYKEEIKITRSELNYEDVKRYRIKEVWYFDKETSTMKVRILGIAPIRDVYDDNTGIFKYELPLFWVYYPQLREILAKEQVVNDKNDAAPMTWFDLFEARLFSSYIYKESNTLDLRLIDQYADGVDRLLESEKIKMELFNFEHDLWTY